MGCQSESGISDSENQFLNCESCSEKTPKLSESSENGLFTPRAFVLKWGGPRPLKREVLNGVGADGVGVKFPIFPVNCSYLPLVLG